MENVFSNILQNMNIPQNKDNLLQNQKINQESINELLNTSMQSIICGPDCQKQKITDELKQKYLDAETNMQTAPIKFEENKKNYYVYTEGSTYYNNMLEDELKEKAEKITILLTKNFQEELKTANTMNSYLNSALINSENTKELLASYVDENNKLKLKIKNTYGDIITNDRKTYYETNAFDRLRLWYNVFWYIFYFLVVILIISLFVVKNQFTLMKKIIIIILFIFLPYYTNYIFRFFYNIYKKLYNIFPKNVYNNL
jgi:hypothetical protein